MMRVLPWMAGAWLLVATPALAQDSQNPLQAEACTFEGMLQDVRDALRNGSPALKRYVRERLKEAARAMPPDELIAALEKEGDPGVLEVLGAALVTQASSAEKPELLKSLLARAAKDSDPALRAAAVRGLRRSGSVDSMAKNGNEVSYEQIIRDPAPEVRQAVVENLVEENDKVYYGHYQPVSEAAVSAALASPDPEAAATLLSKVSMEQVGPETVDRLMGTLRSDNPKLRAAGATALGGVPGASSAEARSALVELFRSESDPAVRKAALEGIARLGQAGSLPLLESLRGIDPVMDKEIEAWVATLQTGLQEWHLLLREKQRRQK